MRHSTSARISAPSVCGSSLTPVSSTDWLSIGMPASIEPRAGLARRVGQFAGVVGVQHHVGGLALGLERANELVRDARRIGDRHARVHADDLDVRDGGERATRPACSRRADSTSGSPPVSMTSQISGCAAM